MEPRQEPFNTSGMPSARPVDVTRRSIESITNELEVQTGGLGLINDNLNSIEMLSDQMRSSNLLEFVDTTPGVLSNIFDTISEFAENFANYFGFLTNNSLQDEENRREMIELLRRQNDPRIDPVPPPLPPPPAESGIFGKLITFLGLGSLATGLIGIVTSFSRLNKVIAAIRGFELAKLVSFIESIPLIGKPLIAKFSPLLRFLETAGKQLGKVLPFLKNGSKFVPLLGQAVLIITGIIDAVKGAIDGYKTGGIAGAIKGAISGFFVGLVGSILDLLKDVVSWAATKLGFDGVASALDSFSFSSIVKDTVEFVFTLFEVIGGLIVGIGQWVSTVAAPLVEKFKVFMGDFFTATGEVLGFLGNFFSSFGGLVREGLELLGLDAFVDDNVVGPMGEFFTWIGEFFMSIFTSAKEALKNALGGVDTLKDFYATILRGILPDPRDYPNIGHPLYHVSRAIPKRVYDYAGMDITGDSPTKQLIDASQAGTTASNNSGSLTAYRRSLMSDAEYAALPAVEKNKIAEQFKSRTLSDELNELEKIPKIQPIPSSSGDTLAAAGNMLSAPAPMIINNLGGNVTNTNTSQVNNNSSPFEPILSGSSLGFATF